MPRPRVFASYIGALRARDGLFLLLPLLHRLRRAQRPLARSFRRLHRRGSAVAERRHTEREDGYRHVVRRMDLVDGEKDFSPNGFFTRELELAEREKLQHIFCTCLSKLLPTVYIFYLPACLPVYIYFSLRLPFTYNYLPHTTKLAASRHSLRHHARRGFRCRASLLSRIHRY